jgi:hypothetical protein
MTVVIAGGSASRATAESTTSSRSVILAVRHVVAAASKTKKVDAGTTAGEGKMRACRRNHSVGEPVRKVCTDQRCGTCSPGFSDTLGVQVRPVGVYVGNVVILRL